MKITRYWDQPLVSVSQMELGVINHQHAYKVRLANFRVAVIYSTSLYSWISVEWAVLCQW